MARSGSITPKRERQEQAILEATLRCLGRDGYAATSLHRIAEEAGTHKRMVLYYFRDREQLLERTVVMLGDRLLSEVADAVRGLEEPADVVAAGFDGFWSAITGDRGLLVAYLGLMAESVTDPKLQAATGHINEGFRAIIGKLIADAQRRGRGLLMDKESLIVLIIAGIHGLTLEYVQRGESPALTRAIADFQIWLTTVSAPHDERREVGPTPTAPRR
ncbi:MAG: TetR/AcrR family transcriptional regulator [Solirubrobacterales bacterium]|nr:TetR/AcrR family transcriptional regulator [Solirubrobacterales bacterium]